jgi:ParB/RepB/Spo0J family partition protein
MTGDSGSVPSGPPVTGIENNQTRVVPIDQIVVDGQRRSLDERTVEELMESIKRVGQLNPITGVSHKAADGKVKLVAGLHRLEARKRLGFSTIQCTVLACDEPLQIELAEIDENILRNNPSPAEHAMLTARRAVILKALAEQDGTLSQTATASKQAQRRAGLRPGYDAASVRDKASRTGESKDKIHRSKKRGILGGILKKVRGTSLDKGVELDALAKLSEAEREDLANRAATGEKVSARTAARKPKPEPQRLVPTRQRALVRFTSWHDEFKDLEHLAAVKRQIADIFSALTSDPPTSGETEWGSV